VAPHILVFTVNLHAVVKIIAYALLLMVLWGSLTGQVPVAVAPYLLPLCVTNDCNPVSRSSARASPSR
jgi:hypothetical protein